MKAVEKGSGMPRLCKRRKAVGCQGNAVKKAAGCQGKVAKKGSGMPRKGCEERQWGAKERQWATKGEAVEKGSGMPRKRQRRTATQRQTTAQVWPARPEGPVAVRAPHPRGTVKFTGGRSYLSEAHRSRMRCGVMGI